MLACRLIQSGRSVVEVINSIRFAVDEVEAMVLSHVQIDYTCNILNRVKSGFVGRTFCTSPIQDWCKSMLLGHLCAQPFQEARVCLGGISHLVCDQRLARPSLGF